MRKFESVRTSCAARHSSRKFKIKRWPAICTGHLTKFSWTKKDNHERTKQKGCFMTNIAICHCKLGAAKHSISNDSLNEPDAYDSLKGPDAAGAYNSLKRSSSNHPYGSLNEPDAYGSLKGPDAAGTYDSLKGPDAYDSLKGPDAAGTYDSLKGSDAAGTYDSLKGPDAYDSLKEPDAAGTYDSLKGFIFNTFNQTYKNKLEGKNVQLIFCSNSLLKLSVLYLLGTTQNPGYPYSIGITFIFFQQKSRQWRHRVAIWRK